MFQSIRKLFGPAAKTAARPAPAARLGLEGLEVRDCPATFTINHPAADGQAYSPVSGSLFGSGGPSFLDVRQGAEGDCWLLSSLAAVAARNPGQIRSMFTDLGSATENGARVELYDVRLYSNSGVPESILVDTELPDGGKDFDHPANGVLWVALAEKAYAQANGAGLVTTSHNRNDSYDALGNLGNTGGDAAWALHAITGQSSGTYSFNPGNIAAAWNAGEYVVIGTSNPSSSDIVGGHDYAVVGYNPNSSMPFEVYNPWGTNSSGWAPGTENGHAVYGLFYATGTFLAQNYTSESFARADAGPAGPGGAVGAPEFGAAAGTPSAPTVNRVTPPLVTAAQSPAEAGVNYADYESGLAVWVD